MNAKGFGMSQGMTPFFGGRFEEGFVEGRRLALEQYLNRVIRCPDLLSSAPFKVFDFSVSPLCTVLCFFMSVTGDGSAWCVVCRYF